MIKQNRAQDGGGIFAETGMVIIQNASIQLNEARLFAGSGNGGGINIGSGVMQVLMTNTQIFNNEADGLGGGIFIRGALTVGSSTTVTLTGCSITANGANKGGGVAVDTGGSSTLDLQSNTVIQNNWAVKGGGLYLGAGTFTSTTGYSITGNSAGVGGGLYVVTGANWGGDPFGFLIWGNVADNVNTGAA